MRKLVTTKQFFSAFLCDLKVVIRKRAYNVCRKLLISHCEDKMNNSKLLRKSYSIGYDCLISSSDRYEVSIFVCTPWSGVYPHFWSDVSYATAFTITTQDPFPVL